MNEATIEVPINCYHDFRHHVALMRCYDVLISITVTKEAGIHIINIEDDDLLVLMLKFPTIKILNKKEKILGRR
jgi:hypothetical protein